MNNEVIKLTGISKNFLVGGSERKVLEEINLSVVKGSVVGLIGSNGAGKSTLLKIIAGVIYPSSGIRKIEGRISSLLELGAGFHSELSGLDNIYFYGQLSGFSRSNIKKNLEAIIDFSEIGEHINKKLKYYSSGMFLRLAFSISVFLDFDILLLDEVLGVGDVKFQSKCREKINQLIKTDHKTIIFVSHNLTELAQICDRVILLEHGKVAADDVPSSVIGKYLTGFESGNSKMYGKFISEAKLTLKNTGPYTMQSKINLNLSFLCKNELTDLVIRFLVVNQLGEIMFILNSLFSNVSFNCQPNLYTTIECELGETRLLSGSYLINLEFFHKGELIETMNYISSFVIDNSSLGILEPIQKKGAYQFSKWTTFNTLQE